MKPVLRNDLKALANVLSSCGPLSSEAAALVQAGQRALLAGNPIVWEELVRLAGRPPEAVRATLDAYPGLARFDGLHRLVGLFGLSAQPTGFRIATGIGSAFAWCAWDTLFIPRVVRLPVEVMAHCPVSGARITLRASPEGIQHTDPDDVHVSFLMGQRGAEAPGISGACCSHIHFFAGEAPARRWRTSQPAGLVLTLPEAWHLASLYVQAMLPAPKPALAP